MMSDYYIFAEKSISVATPLPRRQDIEAEVSSSPVPPPSVRRKTRSTELLLVFDFNGVLGRMYDKNERIPSAKEPAVVVHRLNKLKTIILRPDFKVFMAWCLEHFRVALWSSMSVENMHLVCNNGISEVAKKALFVWSKEECTNTGLLMKSKPVVMKELKNVYRQFPRFGIENTLLIDDSRYKSHYNEKNTTICPNTFDPARVDGQFLNTTLKDWLTGLLQADSVPSYVENNPMYNVYDTEMSSRAIKTLDRYKKKL